MTLVALRLFDLNLRERFKVHIKQCQLLNDQLNQIGKGETLSKGDQSLVILKV